MKNEQFLERMSIHLKQAIGRSLSIATSLGLTEVSPGLLLLALSEQKGSVAAEVLKRLKIDAKLISKNIIKKKQVLPEEKNPKTITSTLPNLNNAAKMALEKAMFCAYERSHQHVGTEHLLYGIFKLKEEIFPELIKILESLNLEQNKVQEEIEMVLDGISKFPSISEVKDALNQLQGIFGEGISQGSKQFNKNKTVSQIQESALDVFTTNITSKKIQKNIDPVVGRENEIERLINILGRRTKNNPVLVGEPGVGKTAIVEGLAKRISEGNVPQVLRRKKILSLDLTLLIAGTIYRGEFEARLRQIIEELKDRPDCILFIDEIHNIIGTGSNQGAMDAANMLKPALARGQLRCIGATTIDEYNKYISADPALERRFQSISVEEPTPEQTEKILNGIKKYYESFHNTLITDEAIHSAVDYSVKYIHDNYLPDKAIDLIDEAAAAVKAKVKQNQKEESRERVIDELESLIEKKNEAISAERFEEAVKCKKQISELESKLEKLSTTDKVKKNLRTKVDQIEIAKIIQNKLKIPLDYLLLSETEKLKMLNKELKSKIIGQDNAIEEIIRSLRVGHLGLKGHKKPIASLFFVGPSGVGKTELAKQLATLLYQDENALIRMDMSEFSESHSLSKILGSPAGYVGHKDRNRFTEQLKKRPYSIILLDEIDKAHRDVIALLYQILDQGEITDSLGKKIYFQHSIIILTSNIDPHLYKAGQFGFGREREDGNSQNKKHENIKQKIKERFGSALVGRLDNIIVFNPLNLAGMEKIILNHLVDLNYKLQKRSDLTVKINNQALHDLAKAAYSEDTGARHIESLMEHTLYELLLETLANDKRKKKYTLIKNHETFKLI